MQHLDEGTIHAWLDGALPPDEARQAEVHAAGCESCSAAVAEARGLIAASSMIISRLDGVLGPVEARADAGRPPAHDIAVARAAADARQRPARRSWFSAPGMRAAAAVLVLAGGVAVVQNMTGRDELARVVTDATLSESSPREAAAAPEAVDAVAQDATAASAVQAPAAPPPPTVGQAPALPIPVQATGGVTPTRGAAPQAMVGDLSGMLTGVEPRAGQRSVAPSPAPPVTTGSSAGQGSAAEAQRANLGQERDFSAAAKTAAPAPAPVNPAAAPAAGAPVRSEPPTLADGAASSRELRRLADTLALRREEHRQAEEGAGLRQRLAPQTREQSAVATAAAVGDGSGTAARCVALTLSPWSPERGAIPGAPATRIILSADTGTTGPSKGQRLVKAMPGAHPGSYEHAWYAEVSPSTLVLTWATGSEGIVMRLVRSGDQVTGTARTFGAAGSVERTSAVRGERVDCGAAR